MKSPAMIRYPEVVWTDTLDFLGGHSDQHQPRVDSAALAKIWSVNNDGSISFEWKYDNQIFGGKLTPHETDVDLELWLYNDRDKAVLLRTTLCSTLKGTMFEDFKLERTWLHTGGQWKRMMDTNRGTGNQEWCQYLVEGSSTTAPNPPPWSVSTDIADADVAAVTSQDGKYIFAVAFPLPAYIISNAGIPCVHADPKWSSCLPKSLAYRHGKIYLMKGTLDELLVRVRKEMLR